LGGSKCIGTIRKMYFVTSSCVLCREVPYFSASTTMIRDSTVGYTHCVLIIETLKYSIRLYNHKFLDCMQRIYMQKYINIYGRPCITSSSQFMRQAIKERNTPGLCSCVRRPFYPLVSQLAGIESGKVLLTEKE
jgi:hypothetical protein